MPRLDTLIEFDLTEKGEEFLRETRSKIAFNVSRNAEASIYFLLESINSLTSFSGLTYKYERYESPISIEKAIEIAFREGLIEKYEETLSLSNLFRREGGKSLLGGSRKMNFGVNELFPYNFELTDSGERRLEELSKYAEKDKKDQILKAVLQTVREQHSRETLFEYGNPDSLLKMAFLLGLVEFIPSEEKLELALQRAIREGMLSQELLETYHRIALGQELDEKSLDRALTEAVKQIKIAFVMDVDETLDEERHSMRKDEAKMYTEEGRSRLKKIYALSTELAETDGNEYLMDNASALMGLDGWDSELVGFDVKRMSRSDKTIALDSVMYAFHNVGSLAGPPWLRRTTDYLQTLFDYRGEIDIQNRIRE